MTPSIYPIAQHVLIINQPTQSPLLHPYTIFNASRHNVIYLLIYLVARVGHGLGPAARRAARLEDVRLLLAL